MLHGVITAPRTVMARIAPPIAPAQRQPITEASGRKGTANTVDNPP